MLCNQKQWCNNAEHYNRYYPIFFFADFLGRFTGAFFVYSRSVVIVILHTYMFLRPLSDYLDIGRYAIMKNPHELRMWVFHNVRGIILQLFSFRSRYIYLPGENADPL